MIVGSAYSPINRHREVSTAALNEGILHNRDGSCGAGKCAQSRGLSARSPDPDAASFKSNFTKSVRRGTNTSADAKNSADVEIKLVKWRYRKVHSQLVHNAKTMRVHIAVALPTCRSRFGQLPASDHPLTITWATRAKRRVKRVSDV